MRTEISERTAGVGALIVVPEDPGRGFLTLRELITKRSSNRLIGARTLPMETIESGESHAAAWERLTREEIQLCNVQYNLRAVADNILCRCELRPGVVLYVSILEVPSSAEIIIGSESQEVADLRWTALEEVLDAPKGDLAIRPGMREVLEEYMRYRKKPEGFRPRTYAYPELKDKIPDAIFDLVESGFSLIESLFRLRLASAPFAKSVVLAHSKPLPESALAYAEVI